MNQNDEDPFTDEEDPTDEPKTIDDIDVLLMYFPWLTREQAEEMLKERKEN